MRSSYHAFTHALGFRVVLPATLTLNIHKKQAPQTPWRDDCGANETTPMLTVVNAQVSSVCVNAVMDSLYLRVMRECIPSDWFASQCPKWREYQLSEQERNEPYIVEVPGLGSFQLLPFSQRPYLFTLVNPEIANIYIWNPKRWETAISSQTGQFLIDFRSKYLQFHGVEGVRRFYQNLTHAFCCSLMLDEYNGWEIISRGDLATDTQVAIAPDWDSLGNYVTRARQKEGDDDVTFGELRRSKALLTELLGRTPPKGNKGGGTYNLRRDQLELFNRVISRAEAEAEHNPTLNRVCWRKDLQTVYFGRFASSLIGVRYDKLASLRVQNKEYLKPIWRANGWDGKSAVWRTEFRLKGEFLRQAGLVLGDGDHIQDMRHFEVFVKHIPQIWRYLTTEWLRLTIPSESDCNNRRWELDPEWVVVQNAFASAEAIKRYPPAKNPEPKQLQAQLVGVALTIAAKCAEADSDEGSAIAVLNDLASYFSDATYTIRLAQRRRLLGCDDFSHSALADKLRAEWLLQGNGS